MSSHSRPLALLALVLFAGTAGAQGVVPAPAPGAGAVPAPVPPSAPLRDVRYELTFDRATARRHLVHVATSFGVDGDAPAILSLPTWTPGAYELTPFARWVTNFAATGDNGRVLAWDKVDHDTWRVRPAGAKTVTVSFDFVADSLDNAMAWSRPDFLLVNGTNVFLYPEGRTLDFASRVQVHTEPTWKVVTGMHPTGEPRSYSATNYHDLVDMPFFIGVFDVDSNVVAGKWTRFATYPAGSMSGAARQSAWNDIKRMIPAQVAIFGETPWETYSIMQIADSTYQGASGLEHQASHVDVITPLAIGNPFLSSLYSHEIFHSFNVKRMRPAALWPYRYDAPQPTDLLWVSEGITDYYGDLALLRGGVVNAEGFYQTTSGKIAEVAQAPPVSLEDASLSTWVHPVDGTGYLYYPKGSLAGFMLDILIRDASDDQGSLDTAMRDVYQRSWKQGRGFTGEEFWAAVARAAGGRPPRLPGVSSWQEIYGRYVDGREPYPWAQVLPLGGMLARTERAPRLGISTEGDSSGVRVTAIDSASAAATAGLRVGDYVLVVGDVTVGDPSFGTQFRQRYGNTPEGTKVPVRVRRGTETLTIDVPLRYAEIGLRITEDPNANARAKRVREGILTGK